MSRSEGKYWDIGWVLNRGCAPVSEACLHCWSAAEAYMRQFQKNPKVAEKYKGLTRKVNGIPVFNGTVRLCPENLEIPLHKIDPKVFSIWNDLFHESVPFEFIDKVHAAIIMAIRHSHYHTYLILTKRPRHMLKYYSSNRRKQLYAILEKDYDEITGFYGINWPFPNLWLGVTCENQQRADERIPTLLQIPAAHRFVSLEPLLGVVNLGLMKSPKRIHVLEKIAYHPGFQHTGTYQNAISWVIVGAETGPKARYCPIEWIESVVEQCKAANVPCFVKAVHLGTKKKFKVSKKMSEWPESTRARELPFGD